MELSSPTDLETLPLSSVPWSKIHRPRTLEDMILLPSIKRALIAHRDFRSGPSMLFHGPCGVGKTVAAHLLRLRKVHGTIECRPKTDLCDIESAHYIERDWSKPTANIFVVDNVDQLSSSVQMELRYWIESKPTRNFYVFTAIDPRKLIQTLHSSLVPVDFSGVGKDMDLREEFYQRALKILNEKGIDVDPSIVQTIVHRWFPDMRHTLNRLQFEFGMHARPY